MVELSEVLELGIEVNSAESLEDILQVVLELVGRLMPHDYASVALLDESSNTLDIQQILLNPEAGQTQSNLGMRVPVTEENLFGRVFINQKTHLRRESTVMEPFKPVQKSAQVPSHIIAPMISRGKPLGVLTIGSYTRDIYTEELARVFESYAQLTAVAIDNLRNFDKAHDLSIRDGLTKLYNHHYFKLTLQQELHRCRRHQSHCALIMVDIDHFKHFNDTYGHQVGDLVLRETAELLQSRRRKTDMVFRYGGEEFAILLIETGRKGAEIVAKQLLDQVREQLFYHHSSEKVEPIRVSMGVGVGPDDGDQTESLIAAADQALYFAKNNGRDQVCFYRSPETHPEIHRGLSQLSTGGSPGEIPEAATKAPFGSEHMLRLADRMAERLDLSPSELANLKIAVLVHDVGEWGVLKEIQNKRGRLTSRERQIVQTHPRISERVLRKYFKVDEIQSAVLHHHEHFDGTGYPEGLRSEEIPLLARILAVIDTFDALVSERPYRQKLEMEEAIQELRNVAGYQLDPEIVETLVSDCLDG